MKMSHSRVAVPNAIFMDLNKNGYADETDECGLFLDTAQLYIRVLCVVREPMKAQHYLVGCPVRCSRFWVHFNKLTI